MNSLLALSLMGQSCIAQQAVTYAQPVAYQTQSYVAQTYAQPYAVFVAVEDPSTYYAGLVGSEVRAAKRAEAAQQVQFTTDAKIDRLTQIVSALQRRLESQQPTPSSEPPLPQPAQQKRPSPPVPTPGLSSYPLSESVPPPPLVPNRTRDAAVAILTTSCMKCHSADNPSGGLALFDRRGQLAELDRDQLDLISQAVWSGRMPKALPLPTKDQIVIRAWISEASKGESVALNSKRKPL